HTESLGDVITALRRRRILEILAQGFTHHVRRADAAPACQLLDLPLLLLVHSDADPRHVLPSTQVVSDTRVSVSDSRQSSPLDVLTSRRQAQDRKASSPNGPGSRSGRKGPRSRRGGRPRTRSATSSAVAGASCKPARLWPVATIRLSNPGAGP